jgi:hypothetical protein
MAKLWSNNKQLPRRTLGCIPIFNRLDTFELQIRFEHWVKNFPHIEEIYDNGGLEISFNENNLLIEARMSDRQYTMWCLKYPNTTVEDRKVMS